MNTKLLLKKRDGSSRNTAVIAVVFLIIVAGAVYTFTRPPAETETQEPMGSETEPQGPEIPEFEITLTGADGQQATLNRGGIAGMTVIEMNGGLMTSAGSIKGPYKYTAAPLSEVFELIGGITEENSLRVTAVDGYAMVFTWEELSGDFLTFDPVTGDEVEATKPLVPTLAYFEDDEPLPEGHGPIRLVILGEEGLISEGHFWIKQVVDIEVIPAIREYNLTLTGEITEVIDRATFESGTKCPDTTPNHRGVYVDADGQIWTGIPVWLLVGRIDDTITHTANAYNRELADAGAYTVQVIAGDGYAVELNSSFVKLNENIILANELNGAALPDKYWPLRLVGSDLDKSLMVRNIVEIRLVFGEGNATVPEPVGADVPDFELTLVGEMTEVMDKTLFLSGVTCSEYQHFYDWVDGEGNTWTGIPVWLLAGRVDDDNAHGEEAFNRALANTGYQVSFIANDGYHKELDSALIAENNQIIVAYLLNGEPLPEDKAPLRVVGEGLTTGQMVSMIERIELIFP
ncbi:molybdopterin-dependent oxidoreductase [Candidatus Bathyarchaeota archaeon]|nr:molybdopterin-dependent oxidoreductase [Candidatus Bathyarchaeota archaeon]